MQGRVAQGFKSPDDRRPTVLCLTNHEVEWIRIRTSQLHVDQLRLSFPEVRLASPWSERHDPGAVAAGGGIHSPWNA